MPSPHATPVISKILFVDDDPNLLAALRRSLRNLFEFDTATSGTEALQLLRARGPYALLVVDMWMPGMSGLELLEQAKAVAPHAVPIVLTGSDDREITTAAVNKGRVFRFFAKPCPIEVLAGGLEQGLKEYQTRRSERELLNKTLDSCLTLAAEIMGLVAPQAVGRGQMLREWVSVLGDALSVSPLAELETGALMCDLGYASLPWRMHEKLRKGRELSERERLILRRVPKVGHDLLSGIPQMQGVAQIVLYQGKAFDGTGFPADEVAGTKIPLGARMVKMLSDRWTLELKGVTGAEAQATMERRPGQYDPGLLADGFACFPTTLREVIGEGGVIESRPIDGLQIGDIAAADIRTRRGAVLATAGRSLTRSTIEMLRNYADLRELKPDVAVLTKKREVVDPTEGTPTPGR